MSYILDALKRADAERERGLVPGLHSQSAATLPQAAPATRRPALRPVLLIALAALLVAAAAAGWWLTRQRGAMAPAAPAPVPAVVAPAPAVQAQTPAPPTPPALPILAPPPPAPPAASVTTAPAAPAVAPAASSAKVRSLNELAPEVRAQLPQVGISGGTYSSNPEHRMLIANGKVVHEGEEIVPGLRLESIAPGKAVLNHQGTRYSVGY